MGHEHRSLLATRGRTGAAGLVVAISVVLVLTVLIPIARAASVDPQNGTWTINYYSDSNCNTAWTPTMKAGNGFATNAGTAPEVTAGTSIYADVQVSGGDANQAVYYELDGGNSPWSAPAQILTTDSSGNGDSGCFLADAATVAQADKVGPSTTGPGGCTVPEKIAVGGTSANDFDGHDIDHLIILGSDNSNGCTGSSTFTPVDLTVANTASGAFTRTFGWSLAKFCDSPADTATACTVDTAQTSASFGYNVVATNSSFADSLWTVSGAITVSNPNSAAVTGVTLADALSDSTTCAIGAGTDNLGNSGLDPVAGFTVPASGSATFSYTCSPLSSVGTADVATASWGTQNLCGSDCALSGGSAASSAQLSWSMTAVDASVTVTDSLQGTLGTCYADSTFGSPASPCTFQYSSTVSGAAGTCTSQGNTAAIEETGQQASAAAQVCVGADLTVSKTAVPTFTRTYQWTLDKQCTNAADIASNFCTFAQNGGSVSVPYSVVATNIGFTDSAWAVTGTITVSNPNDWEGVDFTLQDAVSNGGSCTVSDSASNAVTSTTVETVAAGGSVEFTYSCAFSSGAGGTNTATAHWDSSLAFTPDNSASGSADFAFTTPSATVDSTVTVSDSSPSGTLGQCDVSMVRCTFTYSEGVAAGTCSTDTATLEETGQSSSAEACVGEDLSVSKTATPTFTRTYMWSIAKFCDSPADTKTSCSFVQDSGGSVTVPFNVVATMTGFVDSNWAVSGAITVTNPNAWEQIAGVTLTDRLSDASTCAVAAGTDSSGNSGLDPVNGFAVPASGWATFPYACSVASATVTSDTATASWSSATYSTPSSSGSGGATVAFSTPTTTIDSSVNVDDTYGASTVQLGTCSVATSPCTFADSRTITARASCQTTSNTATILETGASAKSKAVVCPTGGLTMGFWQNKNGQGILTALSGTPCPSATYLRQYAPFQDLASSATCAQVASYVKNVVGSATAAGASMNAMLKAQMLATALDVFFSAPTSDAADCGAVHCGGNALGAAAPIGGDTVDLTHICANPSATPGTCGGTYESTKSAFGGGGCQKVNALLSYAASKSNVGGSTWYGQVKATQGLAKDTFDAINNEDSFTC